MEWHVSLFRLPHRGWRRDACPDNLRGVAEDNAWREARAKLLHDAHRRRQPTWLGLRLVILIIVEDGRRWASVGCQSDGADEPLAGAAQPKELWRHGDQEALTRLIPV